MKELINFRSQINKRYLKNQFHSQNSLQTTKLPSTISSKHIELPRTSRITFLKLDFELFLVYHSRAIFIVCSTFDKSTTKIFNTTVDRDKLTEIKSRIERNYQLKLRLIAEVNEKIELSPVWRYPRWSSLHLNFKWARGHDVRIILICALLSHYLRFPSFYHVNFIAKAILIKRRVFNFYLKPFR